MPHKKYTKPQKNLFSLEKLNQLQQQHIENIQKVTQTIETLYILNTQIIEENINLRTQLHLQDQYISNVSHELNTPLTSMMIYAEMLEQHLNKISSSPYLEMSKRLNIQLNRLCHLIQNMLDVTRIDKDQLLLILSTFNLNQLIKEKLADQTHITQNHQFILELDDDINVIADKERMGQVIANLLSNAIKYSPLGGKITISTKNQHTDIKVSICDQGIGIPKDALNKIFERFYRVDYQQTKNFPGMGINLFICKSIITMHKGTLFVENKEEGGSKFSFILPINNTEKLIT